jgi:co-chaperonin GroES (HSP10)
VGTPLPETIAPKTIRPFWGRVSVLPSPVEETERPSGVIVPMKFDGADDVKRGVVLAVDDDWVEPERKRAAELLPPGTVVYYKGGTRIHDVVVLGMAEIVAFEVA